MNEQLLDQKREIDYKKNTYWGPQDPTISSRQVIWTKNKQGDTGSK